MPSNTVLTIVEVATPDARSELLRASFTMISWLIGIRAIRANASRMSHAELDAATELDFEDPTGLAADYAALMRHLPNLRIFGGCCGTDHRHVAAIADHCCGRAAAA